MYNAGCGRWVLFSESGYRLGREAGEGLRGAVKGWLLGPA